MTERGGYFTARRARRPLKLTEIFALGQGENFVNYPFIPTIAVTDFVGIIKSPSVRVTPMFLVT